MEDGGEGSGHRGRETEGKESLFVFKSHFNSNFLGPNPLWSFHCNHGNSFITTVITMIMKTIAIMLINSNKSNSNDNNDDDKKETNYNNNNNGDGINDIDNSNNTEFMVMMVMVMITIMII